jgi:hypothetical protein
MPQSPANKICRLQSAHLKTHEGKTNLTLKLTGSAIAQAQAMRTITTADHSGVFAEREQDTNTLSVTIALPGEDPAIQEAVSSLLHLHNLINCRLSHVKLEAGFDQLGDGKNAMFTPAVNITPLTNKKDPEDISGLLTMNVIHKTHGYQTNYAPDPRTPKNALRLFCLDISFPTMMDSLLNAETTVRAIEKEFGISPLIETDLSLVDMKNSTVEHKNIELGVATARLAGNDKALEHAMRTLKRRHQHRIEEVGRGDNYLDIATAKKNEIDPTGLLAALHMSTGCHLPVEVKPLVTRSKTPPYAYEPVVEARIEGDDTGLAKPIMRHALARYAGSFIPENYTVPEEIDPHTPSRVVVHTCHLQEEDAKESAQELAQRLRARLNGELNKGWDYHR